MLALVTYPYRDRETLAVHLAGEEVELTDARFAELCAGGYVDVPAEKPAEPAAPAAEQEAAPQPVILHQLSNTVTSHERK